MPPSLHPANERGDSARRVLELSEEQIQSALDDYGKHPNERAELVAAMRVRSGSTIGATLDGGPSGPPAGGVGSPGATASAWSSRSTFSTPRAPRLRWTVDFGTCKSRRSSPRVVGPCRSPNATSAGCPRTVLVTKITVTELRTSLASCRVATTTGCGPPAGRASNTSPRLIRATRSAPPTLSGRPGV